MQFSKDLLLQDSKPKPSKCSFFKVGFLGYVISSNGVETNTSNTSKIDAVTSQETPKNTDDIRKFLGFTGYYCRFVKGYSKIAKPLNDLGESKKERGRANKNNPLKQLQFVWGFDQQQAFDALKQALPTAPILASPDFTKQHMLVEDPKQVKRTTQHTNQNSWH